MTVASDKIMRILEMARWAPSGDNSQPWRFEIVDESTVVVHAEIDLHNTLNIRKGEPTLLSIGILLEAINIAASHEGCVSQWEYLGAEGNTELVSRNINLGPVIKITPRQGSRNRFTRLIRIIKASGHIPIDN